MSERPWFKDADCVQLYVYLKDVAYVADGKYDGRIIRRGSCPTTRPEMMEATGLSYKKVDKCLRKLTAYNEIVVKGYSKYSVVTICDYDMLGVSDNLFSANLERQRYDKGYDKGTADDTTKGTTPPYNIKEERIIEDNLISPNSPYKKEREMGDVALEVKKLYNKTFDGKLPPCIRLSTATRLQVEECLKRFGRQSIDLVFQQIKTENFSMGGGKTGFIANFTFIFQPRNYQQYLERAQLRQKKQQQPQPAKSVGIITEIPVVTKKSQEEYEREMREYAQQHPDSFAASVVAGWDSKQNNETQSNNIR